MIKIIIAQKIARAITAILRTGALRVATAPEV